MQQIAADRADIVSRARDGKLQLADLEGGTFTISNLGMYGIEQFVAVLNPPQVAILAVGSIEERPTAIDGEFAIVPTMTMTLMRPPRDRRLGGRRVPPRREGVRRAPRWRCSLRAWSSGGAGGRTSGSSATCSTATYYWRERNPGDGPGPAARYVKGLGRPGTRCSSRSTTASPSAPRGTGCSGATRRATASSTRRRRSSRSPSCRAAAGAGSASRSRGALRARAHRRLRRPQPQRRAGEPRARLVLRGARVLRAGERRRLQPDHASELWALARIARMDFDVAVLGGGPAVHGGDPGGAARRRVACVERESELGGTCLRVGCIPTKAWVSTAHALHAAREINPSSASSRRARARLRAANSGRQQSSKQMTGGVASLFKANNVGTARRGPFERARARSPSTRARSG